MASRTLAGSIALTGDWDLGEDGYKTAMDLNWLKLSVLTQAVALDKVSATPGAPAEGDIYIFDDTHPTQANDIAVYDEGAWVYFSPSEGWLCYNLTAGFHETFDGAVWAAL